MAFVPSTRKSTRQAAQQLRMPQVTVLETLKTHLRLKKLQIPIFAAVTAQGKEADYMFCCAIVSKIVFSDKASF
jgi:hypothetical protein